MALQFGVSWLCTLLGCICFPPQTGHNIVHGYYLYESPQTSRQFNSGVYVSPNYEEETQAMNQHGSSYPHRNREDFSPVTSLGEEMVQSQPGSVHEADAFSATSSSPSVQNYKYPSSGYQHPFGLLMKEHTQEPAKGVSFPTINHIDRFIKTMKSSFLTPRSDLNQYFQTARDTLKNINGRASPGHRSNFGRGAYVDNSRNEVWSGQGANYHMPAERPHFPDPVDSTASRISSRVYDNQEVGPSSAVYPHDPSAAAEPFVSAPEKDRVWSTSYGQPDPKPVPPGSFFGQDSSHRGQVTSHPVNVPNSPFQDYRRFSSNTAGYTPFTSAQNIQKPTYNHRRKDFLKGFDTPSGGFKLRKDFHRGTPANVRSPQQPPSLNSYGINSYAPRGQLYIPDDPRKNRKRPALSVQTHQPIANKESMDLNYSPAVYQPVSYSSSASSSSNTLPQRTRGHMSIQTSRPRKPQKQLDRSHMVFTAKPFSPLPGLGKLHGYLGYQKVSHAPSILPKNMESPDPYNQNLVSAIEEPDDIMTRSSGIDPTQSGIVSHAARNPLGSFSVPQRISLNGGYLNAMRAGVLQTLRQPPNAQVRPVSETKEPRNLPYWPSHQLSEPKDSPLNCIVWSDGSQMNKFPHQSAQNTSPSSSNAHLKSKNRYARATAYLSKLCYKSYQQTAKEPWAPRQRK